MPLPTPGKQCSECGRLFTCGSDSPSGSCWCLDYPRVMPFDTLGDCRCPNCLAKAIGAMLVTYIAETPHAEALRTAKAQPGTSHQIEHIDYTIEDGNTVFSAWCLLRHGTCCDNGCRNCPYPPE